MRRILPRRGVVLLLALWVTLFTAFLAAPATASGAPVVVMVDGGGDGKCDMAQNGSAGRDVCELICSQVATTLKAWSPGAALRQVRERQWCGSLSARSLPPDPAPPRTIRPV